MRKFSQPRTSKIIPKMMMKNKVFFLAIALIMARLQTRWLQRAIMRMVKTMPLRLRALTPAQRR